MTNTPKPLKQIEVYDTPSGMGGSFTVSIEAEHGDHVDVRVWYGRATVSGWEAWTEWDGYRFRTERSKLNNKRMQTLCL